MSFYCKLICIFLFKMLCWVTLVVYKILKHFYFSWHKTVKSLISKWLWFGYVAFNTDSEIHYKWDLRFMKLILTILTPARLVAVEYHRVWLVYGFGSPLRFLLATWCSLSTMCFPVFCWLCVHFTFLFWKNSFLAN